MDFDLLPEATWKHEARLLGLVKVNIGDIVTLFDPENVPGLHLLAARHPSQVVRASLAQTPGISAEVAARLMGGTDEYVRCLLASTTDHQVILERILLSGEPILVQRALANPSLPASKVPLRVVASLTVPKYMQPERLAQLAAAWSAPVEELVSLAVMWDGTFGELVEAAGLVRR